MTAPSAVASSGTGKDVACRAGADLAALYAMQDATANDILQAEVQIGRLEQRYFAECSATGCGDVVRGFEPLEDAFVRHATKVRALPVAAPLFRALPRVKDQERVFSRSSTTGPAAAASALPPQVPRPLHSYYLVPVAPASGNAPLSLAVPPLAPAPPRGRGRRGR
eukprot:TRINITY_DN697_c0_g1_i1.p2 TRINITY_DN697_c0_g1~~TRINITY_DN697_c0_g1_i1.p2  ORF type:complete len:189 (-),score=18.72 TRINITY_DN697_c0_g1_i1:638-1135(-)